MPVMAVEATIWKTPPSKNEDCVRGSKGKRAATKALWQQLICDELRALNLGRIPDGVQLLACVTVRFGKNAKQERENYRQLFAEALGEALREEVLTARPDRRNGAGVIADDTDDRWELLFDIAPERGAGAVTIRLFWLTA